MEDFTLGPKTRLPGPSVMFQKISLQKTDYVEKKTGRRMWDKLGVVSLTEDLMNLVRFIVHMDFSEISC